jgi:hypothetical protein
MAKFVPRIRGYNNPVLKDPSVCSSQEQKLYGAFYKNCSSTAIAESVIDLRDMQLFILESIEYIVRWPLNIQVVLDVTKEAFEYFLGRLEASDAANLRSKCSVILHSLTPSNLVSELETANLNVTTLININLAVMRNVAKRSM